MGSRTALFSISEKEGDFPAKLRLSETAGVDCQESGNKADGNVVDGRVYSFKNLRLPVADLELRQKL